MAAAILLPFYVFWEVMLLPMYFLIGVRGPAAGIRGDQILPSTRCLGSVLMLDRDFDALFPERFELAESASNW